MNDCLYVLELCFFNTAIADVYRAIRGGSFIGAFTQSMCAIDAMAYLSNALPEKGNRVNFEKWVQDWIVPLNKDCRPDVLYALRCGLVHTYGYADRMKKVGIKRFSYVHNHPELHWMQSPPNVYVLNLESHVAEVTMGAWNFFERLKGSCSTDPTRARSIIERSQKLIYVQNYAGVRFQKDGQVLVLSSIHVEDRFAGMDNALASLDDQVKPTVGVLAHAIRSIYQQKGESNE